MGSAQTKKGVCRSCSYGDISSFRLTYSLISQGPLHIQVTYGSEREELLSGSCYYKIHNLRISSVLSRILPVKAYLFQLNV